MAAATIRGSAVEQVGFADRHPGVMPRGKREGVRRESDSAEPPGRARGPQSPTSDHLTVMTFTPAVAAPALTYPIAPGVLRTNASTSSSLPLAGGGTSFPAKICCCQ